MLILYNLDAILAVSYRVRSSRGVEFRRWASIVPSAPTGRNVFPGNFIDGGILPPSPNGANRISLGQRPRNKSHNRIEP